METFILFEDRVGLQLHALLVAAAQRGVQVDLTIDGWGSPDLSAPFVRTLAEAGARLHVFDPGPRPFGLRPKALRRLHLMEEAAIGEIPYPFHGDGDGVVNRPAFAPGRVSINATQYFEGVPELAWNFHIGGYQPAQKWLKDRKGRALSYDDVRHYQKIIKILTETDRIMHEIELPLD